MPALTHLVPTQTNPDESVAIPKYTQPELIRSIEDATNISFNNHVRLQEYNKVKVSIFNAYLLLFTLQKA